MEPLRELGPDAVAHHEWVNGEGYHLQLKGDQTNRRQRILAVSDAYASLTDTGEAKMPPEMALDELKGSGWAPSLTPMHTRGLSRTRRVAQ